MTDTATKSAIVDRGVKAHAIIDKRLAEAHKAALANVKVVEDGIKAGMVPKALAAKLLLAKVRSLPGKIAEAAALAAELHIECTAISTENGVDLGTVSSVGGIPFPAAGDGEMTTMGGGGR